MKAWMLIAALFLLFFLFFIYACVTAAGRADDQMEQYLEEQKNKQNPAPDGEEEPDKDR